MPASHPFKSVLLQPSRTYDVIAVVTNCRTLGLNCNYACCKHCECNCREMTVNLARPALMFETSVVDKLLAMSLISVLLLASTTSVHSQCMTTQHFIYDIVAENAALFIKFVILINLNTLIFFSFPKCTVVVETGSNLFKFGVQLGFARTHYRISS